MILVFLAVHYLLVKKLGLLNVGHKELFFLFIATTMFYFKLRLYDEVKDYDLDCIINKNRPLPRGLLKHKDMYLGMFICILIEILTYLIFGRRSLPLLLVSITYSLFMYKEFFIPQLIRPHLTTYALSHTIVTGLLSFSIFSYLTNMGIESYFKFEFIMFSISNWMLFNIFEFGRKTFSKSEERKDIDTYSSIFGKTGAILLVFSQVIISIVLILKMNIFNNLTTYIFLTVLFLITLIISVLYVFSDRPLFGKSFRNMSSIYIIAFYIILSLSLVVNQ
jgi:4-hydroxybenzoate polyprenyltransferase